LFHCPPRLRQRHFERAAHPWRRAAQLIARRAAHALRRCTPGAREVGARRAAETVRSMVSPSSAMRLRTMGRISRGFTPQTRHALELMINVAASRRKLSLL